MFKKALFIAALSGAILSTGSLTATAQAHTLNTTLATEDATVVTAPAAAKAPGIFDLSRLDATHRGLVIDALAAYDYDWNLMKAALKRKTGKTQIPIEVKDISKWNACGLGWPNGLIQIDDQVLDHVWFQQVVVHEVGHMIDFFHLGPARLHGKIAKILGGPWSVTGHDFVSVALQLFSANPIADMTDTSRLELRTLLGG